MAYIRIGNVMHFATKDKHTSTDWQVALDQDFTQIIDESINDEVNLTEWHTPLPKINEPGFYSDQDMIYARVRLRYGQDVSNWLYLNDSQNDQDITETTNFRIVNVTHSDDINMQ